MSGSNIFVMYTSADGKNVTLSPRLGTGHVEPKHTTHTQVTLLGGSGVSNGKMTANVRCSNCESWSGGTMDFTGSSSEWIHAYKSGDSMNTDDLAASISRHDNASPFPWSLTSAKGGDSINPFVSNAVTNGTATSGSSDTGSASSFTNANAPFGGNYQMGDRIILAHGVLACLAFVGLFPIGGILIRIGNMTNLVWIHAALQIVAYIIYIIAFGMGAYLMSQLGDSITIHAHPVIGGIIFLVLLSQPLSGFLHHRLFKKYSRRTGWSYAHLSIGRAAILLGMVNGGLGLALAGAGVGAKTAYGIVAAIMAIIYIVCIVLGDRKRRRNEPPSYGQATRLKDETSDANAPIVLMEHFGKNQTRAA